MILLQCIRLKEGSALANIMHVPVWSLWFSEFFWRPYYYLFMITSKAIGLGLIYHSCPIGNLIIASYLYTPHIIFLYVLTNPVFSDYLITQSVFRFDALHLHFQLSWIALKIWMMFVWIDSLIDSYTWIMEDAYQIPFSTTSHIIYWAVNYMCYSVQRCHVIVNLL